MKTFKLCLIVNPTQITRFSIEDFIHHATSHGVDAIQLRAKNLEGRELVMWGRQLLKIMRQSSHNIPLIVNDRLDVALAIDAQGVHLGQQDLPIADARHLLGPQKIIGLSIDAPYQATADNVQHADYLGISGVFPSTTKKTATTWSPLKLTALRRQTTKRLIGVGGITPDNVSSLANWGLDGAAVCAAICNAATLAQVAMHTQHLKDQLRCCNNTQATRDETSY